MAPGMTLRRLLALLLPIALAAPAAADPQKLPTPQAEVAASLPAPFQPAPLKPALWRIADADTTIYLFGTIHVLPKDEPWFVGPLASAADGSTELVTEIGEVDPAQIVAVVSELGFLPPGKSLRDMMSPADRTAFEAALVRLKLPPDGLDRCEPWYAANALLLMQLRSAGVEGANGPETFLAARFAEKARPRTGLETIRFQLGLFDALPLDAQLRYLREVVDGGAGVVEEVAKITREWGQGNAETLAEAMNADEEDPVLLQRLLLDRNKTWSRWIAARLDQPGTVFMAVGAGHLAGRGSVQDELSALGLSATRVQ